MSMEKWTGILVLFPMALLAMVTFLIGEALPGMFHGILHALEEVSGGPLADATYQTWQDISQLTTFLRITALALISGVVIYGALIWRQRLPLPLHKLQ